MVQINIQTINQKILKCRAAEVAYNMTTGKIKPFQRKKKYENWNISLKVMVEHLLNIYVYSGNIAQPILLWSHLRNRRIHLFRSREYCLEPFLNRKFWSQNTSSVTHTGYLIEKVKDTCFLNYNCNINENRAPNT